MDKIIFTDSRYASLAQLSQVLNGTPMAGTDCRSPYALLDTGSESQDVIALQASRLISGHRSAFPIYGSMSASPDFIHEVLSFAGTCLLENIPLDGLPEGSAGEKELKEILRLILTLDLPEKHMVQSASRLKETIDILKRNHTVLFRPAFARSFFMDRVQNEMKQYTEICPEENVSPACDLHTAENTRRELEAIAQDIVMSHKKVNVILCSPASQMPAAEAVFTRYGIPYSAVGAPRPSLVFNRYCALAALALHQDKDAFLHALQCSAFTYETDGETMDWLREAMTAMTVDHHLSAAFRDSPFPRAAEVHARCEDKAIDLFAHLKEPLDLLFSSHDPRTALIHAYDVLRTHPCFRDKECLMEGIRLRRSLEAVLPWIETEADAEFLLSAYAAESHTVNILRSDVCFITDLTHPVPVQDVTYVVGCEGTAYPGFTGMKGLFDEAYAAAVPGFPSLEARHNLYMRELNWIDRSARETVHYSFASGDYDGREKQLAYELEIRFPRSAKWPLQTKKPVPRNIHRVSEQSIRQAVIHDDALTASVSAAETYFACPAHWLYGYAMGLREPESAALDVNTFGTLWHALLEDLVSDAVRRGTPKAYPDITETDLRAYLAPAMNLLRQAHPGSAAAIAVTEERMVRSMYKELQFLKEAEDHTVYAPAACEEAFGPMPISEHVKIRGRADRIDTFGTSFRILDYKSSPHTLSEAKFRSGQQLQLLTYAVLLETLRRQNCAGVWYVCFNAFNITHTPGTLIEGRAPKAEVRPNTYDPDDVLALRRKEQRLAGWLLDEVQAAGIDETADTSKKSLPSLYVQLGGKTYRDKDLLKEDIAKIYEIFYAGVCSGDFTAAPLPNACTYCPFKCLCRFRGSTRFPKDLLKEDEKDA